MTRTVHTAAKALLAKLSLPGGMVNTVAGVENGKPVIRVLVSDQRLPERSRLPKSFQGYPVLVEQKPRFRALAG